MNINSGSSVASYPFSERSIPGFECQEEIRINEGAADIEAWQDSVPGSWRLFLKYRLVGLLVFHAVIFATIYWLCYVIRFDGAIPLADLNVMMATMPLIVALKVAILL